MRLFDAYVSYAEEAMIGGAEGVAVLVPAVRCGLECAFCYYRYDRQPKDWIAVEIASWVGESGVRVLEWCGWPPVEEAREVARRLGDAVTIVLKTSGDDAEKLPDLLGGERFYDVYLPDIKFGMGETAALLAAAPTYVERSTATLAAMADRFPEQRLSDGCLRRGVLARHLMLPGFDADTREALWRFSGFSKRYGWPLSLLDVYMPPQGMRERCNLLAAAAPQRAEQLHRLTGLLTDDEYAKARRYARELGVLLAR